MRREEVINFLISRPYELGKALGFNDLTELHNKWILDMLRGTEDTSLMAHRGSYKTTCVSIALALIITLLPNKRTMFMRKTDDDVKEVIKQVKKIIINPKFSYLIQCIYGYNINLVSSSVSEITTNLNNDTKGTAQLVGIGTGASLTGKHFDYIFTDDIININDRISKAERERTKIIYQELQNIKNRGGRIFNTLTPWHKEDASILMPNIKKYDCYSTNLISKEDLEKIKRSMTPSLFSANYELRHIAEEDLIFENPQFTNDITKVEQGIGHIDAAYQGSDYTAFTVIKVVNDKFYVYGKMWRKNVVDLEDIIINLAKLKMCGKIYNEINADKGFLARDLETKGARVELYRETTNKYIKITSYLKAVWDKVIFTSDTDKEYIQQICDYNENAEHDDAPDSLASLIRIIDNKQRSYFSFE